MSIVVKQTWRVLTCVDRLLSDLNFTAHLSNQWQPIHVIPGSSCFLLSFLESFLQTFLQLDFGENFEQLNIMTIVALHYSKTATSDKIRQNIVRQMAPPYRITATTWMAECKYFEEGTKVWCPRTENSLNAGGVKFKLVKTTFNAESFALEMCLAAQNCQKNP